MLKFKMLRTTLRKQGKRYPSWTNKFKKARKSRLSPLCQLDPSTWVPKTDETLVFPSLISLLQAKCLPTPRKRRPPTTETHRLIVITRAGRAPALTQSFSSATSMPCSTVMMTLINYDAWSLTLEANSKDWLLSTKILKAVPRRKSHIWRARLKLKRRDGCSFMKKRPSVMNDYCKRSPRRMNKSWGSKRTLVNSRL